MDSVSIEPALAGNLEELCKSAGFGNDIKEFPSDHQDYTIDHEKPLGVGQWSTVWGAEAITSLYAPKKHEEVWKLRRQTFASMSLITPPTTPVRSSFGSGFTRSPYDLAIKVPSGRSAGNVILSEARISTYLSLQESLRDHVVSFYGLDRRNGSIVMQALPLPLAEGSHSYRNQHATSALKSFPQIALHLLEGLTRLHEAGVVHADIKPSNILMDFSSEALLPLFTDFSASFMAANPPASHTAAGTWEFLAPELCKSFPSPPTPDYASDVYALAVTLLHFIIDGSPFASAPNTFLMRDMVKKGQALEYALAIPEAASALNQVQAAVPFDLFEFLRMGLTKDPEERPNAKQWLSWLAARAAE